MLRHFTVSGTVLLCAAAIFAASCSTPAKRMVASERHACIAKGGYESRGPFGHPFCQFSYADGGKACSGKSDCEGKCLLSADGPPGINPKPGNRAQGLCEAERATFGCYAEIDNGKVSAQGAICWD
jgi:hypothetical protein